MSTVVFAEKLIADCIDVDIIQSTPHTVVYTDGSTGMCSSYYYATIEFLNLPAGGHVIVQWVKI